MGVQSCVCVSSLYARADPTKVQYQVMTEALRHVALVNDWDMDDVRVWVSLLRFATAQHFFIH